MCLFDRISLSPASSNTTRNISQKFKGGNKEKEKEKKRKKIGIFFVTSQRNEGSRNWIVSARMGRVVATVIARNPIAMVKTNGDGANRSRASASRDFHPVSHRDSTGHAVYPSHRLHQSQSSLAVETMESSTSVERCETRYRGEAVAATATAAVQKKESRVESSIEKRRTRTLAMPRRNSKAERKRKKNGKKSRISIVECDKRSIKVHFRFGAISI